MRMISPLADETADVSDYVRGRVRAYFDNALSPPQDPADDTAERGPVLVGVDVGQQSDYTAIIVSEIEKRPDNDGNLKNHYLIRRIERIPLGTAYSDVVLRCKTIYEKLNKRPRFIVDASGARPIYDLFRAQGVPILPIQITAGTSSRIEGGYGYVSKLELASTLQILSSANRIHLPALSRFSRALRDEARSFELRVTESGNITFGAEGRHKDDLIMALTYILWFGERRGGVDRPRVRWIS